MRARRWPLLVLTMAVPVLGCASGGGDGGNGSPSPSRSRDVLSTDEITDGSISTAYEAVQRFRNSWLRTRGSTTSTQNVSPVVYVEGVRFGDTESLRSIRIEDVQEMRFINARDATTRFGTGVTGGVIEVIRRGRR